MFPADVWSLDTLYEPCLVNRRRTLGHPTQEPDTLVECLGAAPLTLLGVEQEPEL